MLRCGHRGISAPDNSGNVFSLVAVVVVAVVVVDKQQYKYVCVTSEDGPRLSGSTRVSVPQILSTCRPCTPLTQSYQHADPCTLLMQSYQHADPCTPLTQSCQHADTYTHLMQSYQHADPCKSLTQSYQHADPCIPPLSFLQAGCPSCRPANSVKALTAHAFG